MLDTVVARLLALPGVVAATPINAWPYGGSWDVPAFAAEGQDATTAAANPALNLEAIGPRHFETLGVPVVRGRAFTSRDVKDTTRVAILSEDVATRTWPGADPIGRRLKIGGFQSGEPWLTVVGVAAGTRYRELAAARPTLYLPAAQFLDTAERVAIRTAAAPASVAPLIRGHVEAIDPGIKVLRVATFATIVGGAPGPTALSRDPVRRLRHHGGAPGGDRALRRAGRVGAPARSARSRFASRSARPRRRFVA